MPSTCGRTGAGGTTRWNKVHKSAGAIRSTSTAVVTPDCREITPVVRGANQVPRGARSVAGVPLQQGAQGGAGAAMTELSLTPVPLWWALARV
jgi:hypothetical protein